MYRKNIPTRTNMNIVSMMEGETIEQKIDRIVNNNEPIRDETPMIFTEREEGVLAGYDIRTDRFDVALDGIDKIQKSDIARREMKLKKKKEETQGVDNPAETGDIQGTTGTSDK